MEGDSSAEEYNNKPKQKGVKGMQEKIENEEEECNREPVVEKKENKKEKIGGERGK